MICSDFGQKISSEIRTIRFERLDFGITVNVRKPDVRFGEPDEKTSGFRIVRISDVRFIQLYPVFGRPVHTVISENRTFMSGFRTLYPVSDV